MIDHKNSLAKAGNSDLLKPLAKGRGNSIHWSVFFEHLGYVIRKC
jgi:hypothetical protein